MLTTTPGYRGLRYGLFSLITVCFVAVAIADDTPDKPAKPVAIAEKGEPKAEAKKQPIKKEETKLETPKVAKPLKLGIAAFKGEHLTIDKDCLEQNYLISMATVPQHGAATGKGLTGKVGYFKAYADEVVLYEASRGKSVTSDLPTTRILAVFPIVEQNEKTVTFDFGEGINRVFTQAWYSTSSSRSSSSETTFKVNNSRIIAIEPVSNSRLYIRQTIQYTSSAMMGGADGLCEIRYYLSRYQPGDYQPKENNSLTKYLEYFKTYPLIEETTGRNIQHIIRFDPEKPFTYYYSANTPEEFRDAVEDGILYWNRVLGEGYLKAEMAPEGISAPHPDYSMVQWVPWDSAGYAYADVMCDPLTGEALHCQVFMTSTFAVTSVERARAALRRLEPKAEEPGDDKPGDDESNYGGDDLSQWLASGSGLFQPVDRMEVDPAAWNRAFADGLQAMLAKPDTTDAQILAVTQDYVREIVAHEVGHTLGLRHNFASSLQGNMSLTELNKWFNGYLSGEEVTDIKGKYPATSMMDYHDFRASVYIGHLIGETDRYLSHDHVAIRWGYFDNESLVKKRKLLFGTDRDPNNDCLTFDYGSDPLINSFEEIAELSRRVPQSVIERFIAAKAPRDARDVKPLNEVSLNPGSTASMVTSDYRAMLAWLNTSADSIKVVNRYPYVGPLNEDAVLKAHWDALNKQLEKVGGIKRALFSFVAVDATFAPTLGAEPKDIVSPEKFDADKMYERFEKMLDSDRYKEFIGADGEKHSFTPAEKKLIRSRAKLYFDELEDQVLVGVIKALGGVKRNLGVEANGTLEEDDVISTLEKELPALAKAVLTAKDEEKTLGGTINKARIEVVDYRYDIATRKAAAQLLSPTNGSFSAWSTEAKEKLKTELKADVDAALNIPALKEFKDSQLSRPLRLWYLQQQSVLGAL